MGHDILAMSNILSEHEYHEDYLDLLRYRLEELDLLFSRIFGRTHTQSQQNSDFEGIFRGPP